MRRAALALLLMAGGCTSAAETAYREQIECLALFDVPPEEMGAPPPGSETEQMRQLHREALTKRDAFRTRAIERGVALGKSPDQVRAEIRAAHRALTAELDGMGAHPAEERAEQLDELCTARLRS